MNKQVKINIKDKDYYCDMEVLKLIERLQDKVELLEYNRDKAIEYITSNEWAKDYKLSSCRTHLLDILRGDNNEESN